MMLGLDVYAGTYDFSFRTDVRLKTERQSVKASASFQNKKHCPLKVFIMHVRINT